MPTPEAIMRGLNAEWVIDSSAYPAADGWTVEYALINATEQHSFTSSTVDGEHKVALDAATTGSYGAGEYFYQAVAKKGTDAYPLETGHIVIKPNFKELTAGFDARPHCKKVLDAIEATLEGKASKDQARYIIGSRRLDRYTFEELLVLRDRYKAEWVRYQRAEKLKQGLGGSGNVLVRF